MSYFWEFRELGYLLVSKIGFELICEGLKKKRVEY
jgi:hypothetical protein